MTTAPIYPQAEPWTIADLDRLPDDAHYEILDGSLVVSPPATPRHQLAVHRLQMLLEDASPPGLQVLGGPGVHIDAGLTYFQPDVCVLDSDAVQTRPLYFEPGDVILAIEVVSPSSISHDRLVKPAKYAEVGIPHFWRVELAGPGAPFVVRYAVDGHSYREVGTVHAGAECTVDAPVPLVLRPGDLISR